ncbi:MAG: hypothetical protein LBP39_03750 [Rickettsiales bacterium]|jgi:hypothetical protein|nr:hypothetical protein [Rickettsiales bacterium]
MRYEKIHIDEANEFKKIKRIIGIIINLLEKRIVDAGDGGISCDQGNLQDFFIKDQDSVVSTICKLGNLMIKLSYFELDSKECVVDSEEIDLNIMKNYIETMIDSKNKLDRELS